MALELDTIEQRDPEAWVGEYACGPYGNIGKIKAVEEPCEFHRQQAIDAKQKHCVKCKVSLQKYLKPEKKCWRCGSRFKLEADHIVPKSRGGGESKDNKRWLCSACHDFRHARDSILKEIEKFMEGNPAQLTMWLFRLGVLEWFNQPTSIRVHGYRSYWDLPETHYERWYEYIKMARKGRTILERMGLSREAQQISVQETLGPWER